MKPLFKGQKVKMQCPKTGENTVWVARYKKEELRWWCIHKNINKVSKRM